MNKHWQKLRNKTAANIRHYRNELRKLTYAVTYASGRTNIDYALERVAVWRDFGRRLPRVRP